MCATLNLRSQVRISEVAQILLIRGLFLIFVIALHRAASCVLASVCEALPLCCEVAASPSF